MYNLHKTKEIRKRIDDNNNNAFRSVLPILKSKHIHKKTECIKQWSVPVVVYKAETRTLPIKNLELIYCFKLCFQILIQIVATDYCFKILKRLFRIHEGLDTFGELTWITKYMTVIRYPESQSRLHWWEWYGQICKQCPKRMRTEKLVAKRPVGILRQWFEDWSERVVKKCLPPKPGNTPQSIGTFGDRKRTEEASARHGLQHHCSSCIFYTYTRVFMRYYFFTYPRFAKFVFL